MENAGVENAGVYSMGEKCRRGNAGAMTANFFAL